MTKTVADGLWEMLIAAGVKRCYGIVGDALNPVIDAMRRSGAIDFVHVRHEEYGVFAAVAESYLTEEPVAVCGTAGPGVTHLINGLLDAKKEGVPIIALAGDADTSAIDTDTIEELNPYSFFAPAAFYIGRLVDPRQLRPVVGTAIRTALARHGPTVISLPGDVAVRPAPDEALRVPPSAGNAGVADESSVRTMARLVNGASTVTIFGGDGCRNAGDQVRELAATLKAPVGYTLRGKQWLEHDNPNAVGMTGLLGYGACWEAINHADVLLMLGTDFPYVEFLPQDGVAIIQVDREPGRLGRRAPLEHGVVGEVGPVLDALAGLVEPKKDDSFLRKHVHRTERFERRLQHYVEHGPNTAPVRPEFLVAALSELADDDAMFFADTGTACIWAARHLHITAGRRLFGSFVWASMASASPNAFGAALAFPGRQAIALCGDGGFSMLALGDLITQVHHEVPVVNVVLNNQSLDFVNIEQQEAGLLPYGTDMPNPDFSKVASALGANGIRIETPAEVVDGVRAALAHRTGPTVLDVLVDPLALSLPSHIPGHTVRGFALSQATQTLHGSFEHVLRTIAHNIRLA